MDLDDAVYRCIEGIEWAAIKAPDGRTFIADHSFLDEGEPEVYESKGYLKE